MLMNYNDVLNVYKNEYGIKKAIKNGKIHKVEKGIYSNEKYDNDLAAFNLKCNNPIFTMDSAFYYWDIGDFVPDEYVIASDRDSTKYKRKDIKQYFMNKDILEIGKTTLIYDKKEINIYDRERLLIELIRYKSKLPYDYYKEIILWYRDNIDMINIQKLNDYAILFPKKDLIERTIRAEVL